MKVDEVKVLVMWYRQAQQDLPVPTTKLLLLAWLRETCHRGNWDPPPLPDTRPVEAETEALDVDDATAVWALDSHQHSGSSPLDPMEEDTQFLLMKCSLSQLYDAIFVRLRNLDFLSHDFLYLLRVQNPVAVQFSELQLTAKSCEKSEDAK